MITPKLKKKSVTATPKGVAGPKLAATKTAKPARTARSADAQESNRRDRREYILAAAVKLFAKTGYKSATMDQLSALTGLNKGTIYYYYESKADILYDLCISTIDALTTDILPTLEMAKAKDGLVHFITVMLRWVLQNKELCRVYFQESLYFKELFSKTPNATINERRRASVTAVYKILQKGCDSGEFRPLDVTMTGRNINGMLLWSCRWPESETQIDIDKAVTNACEMILRGVAAT